MEQFWKKFTICAVLVFYAAGSAYAERVNKKPKENFNKTLRRGEREGRDLEQQPDRIIESLGVRPGDTACDIGAGTGYFSFKLAKVVGEGGKVYAVDIDQDAVNYIENKIKTTGAKNVVAVKSEETIPKLPPSSCDKVLMVNVYYLLWAPVTTMKNIKAVLKSGAEVAIIGVKKDAPVRGTGQLRKLRVSQEEVLSQMEEAGYKLVRSYDFLSTQYFLVFQKRNDDAL